MHSHPPVVITDENDNTLGALPLPEVRSKGLIHRIVRIMIEDESGRILLQKRAAKMTWPNCWDNSAAGHVDVGEDYLTAAKRELHEEIGVDAELNEVGKYYSENQSSQGLLKRFNKVFTATINYTPDNLQTEEVSEVKWFSVAEIKDLIKLHPGEVTDGLIDVFAKYYQ
jgi:isopentenyldiphosphate isomerase